MFNPQKASTRMIGPRLSPNVRESLDVFFLLRLAVPYMLDLLFNERSDSRKADSRTSTDKTWGPARADRPSINFIFRKPQRAIPQHIQPKSQPTPWIWNGFIVLDHEDNPMRWFDDCPTTLVSQSRKAYPLCFLLLSCGT